MSVNVANLSGGGAFASFNSKNILILDDSELSIEPVIAALGTALKGDYDGIPTDLIEKFKFTPRYYDTAALSTLFPYIGGIAPGTFFGGSNTPCNINSINNDQYILQNAIVGKMPDLVLGMDKCILGPMEIWGLIQSGVDPTNSAAYHTFNPATGGVYTYAPPSIPGTAVIGQQEYTGVFGGVSGMTSFQVQEYWTISHELKWSPVPIQKRTRAFRLQSYRTLVKCKPADATLAALLTALEIQGSNATQGTMLSALAKAANSGASVPTLALTGTSNVSITVNGAALMSAGAMFGAAPLRQGEIGFISTQSGGGALVAPLVLA